MRLDRLQVNGFGHFSELELSLQGPLTVLYGPNEAGKSTLLGFVRIMLFGFPARQAGALRYEPVRGEAHGGRLHLQGEDDDRWMIERYVSKLKGSSSSGRGREQLRITRTLSDGMLVETTQEELVDKLLGGMSSDMFRQLFAISLSELQEVSALQSDELSRYLFHAGIGGGALVLRGEKKLAQEMDKLYRPRGRNQEIARILQACERLEQKVQEGKQLLPRYNEVLSELERTSDELQDEEQKRRMWSLKAGLLRQAYTMRPDWIEREKKRLEVEVLPVYDAFPEQAMTRWRAMQEEKEQLELEQKELVRRLNGLQLELDAVSVDERILAKSSRIKALQTGLARYESKRKDAAALDEEAKSLRSRFNGIIRSIHPSWCGQDLLSFGLTVGEKETVRKFSNRLADLEKELELLRSERYRLEQEAVEAKHAWQVGMSRLKESAAFGRKNFSMLVPKERETIKRLWNEIRVELDQWREVMSSQMQESRVWETEAVAESTIRSLYRKLLAGSAVLTVVLPAILWFTSRSLLGTAIAGVMLLGLDVYLWINGFGNYGSRGIRRDRGQRRQRSGGNGRAAYSSRANDSHRLNSIIGRLIAHPLTAAGQSEYVNATSLSFSNIAWMSEEKELRLLMENWLLWDQRHTALQEETELLRQRADVADSHMERICEEMARCQAEYEQVNEEWRAWLQGRRLPGDLSTEAVLDIFRLVEQGVECHERLVALLAKLDEVDQELAQFEQEAEMLREEIAVQGNGTEVTNLTPAVSEHHLSSGAWVVQFVLDAASRLTENEQLYAKQQMLKSRMEPVLETLERLQDRLDRLADREQALLNEGKVDSGEELLRRSSEVNKRQELLAEIRQLEALLFTGVDASRRQELERLLESYSEEELMQRLTEAEQALDNMEQSVSELQERRGRLLQEKESLESSSRHDDVKQELSEQQAALQHSMDKYAVLAVCQELIARARRVYEEERQPEVLRLASQYMRTMTGGRYERIVLKLGTQELLAEHRDYGSINSAALSRGTAEQLYLAMRLALSSVVAGNRSIPLLLDDVFVNFDRSRLQGVISVLAELSQKQQILMMTCHPHVVEQIRLQIPSAQIINLSG